MTEIFVKLGEKLLFYFKWLKKAENKGNLMQMRKLEYRQPSNEDCLCIDELQVPNENQEVDFNAGGTFHSDVASL